MRKRQTLSSLVFCLRLPTASRVMIASREGYTGLGPRLLGNCRRRDTSIMSDAVNLILPRRVPRACHVICHFFESLTVPIRHLEHYLSPGTNRLRDLQRLYFDQKTQYLSISITNTKSQKPSMADVVGHVAYSLRVPLNSGPLSHLPL